MSKDKKEVSTAWYYWKLAAAAETFIDGVHWPWLDYCPFCDGTPKFAEYKESRERPGGFYVLCGDCEARGPSIDCMDNVEGMLSRQEGCNEAARNWNQRRPQAEGKK